MKARFKTNNDSRVSAMSRIYTQIVTKFKEDESIKWYKARLIAQWYTQVEDIEYEESSCMHYYHKICPNYWTSIKLEIKAIGYKICLPPWYFKINFPVSIYSGFE